MSKFRYIRTAFVVLVTAFVVTTSNVYIDRVIAEPAVMSSTVTQGSSATTSALSIVNSPKAYLGKMITIDAKFDKFSTLGLDYKPAFKSSDDYISFLIKRDDTSFDIPLSEMKLFLKREDAEKYIDLKTNDEIQITGQVFSDALGDAWIDVTQLTLTKKAPDKDGEK